MTNDIRIGLIGAGFIGQMHSLSLGDVGRARREPVIHVDLRAIADRNGPLAGLMAERYGWRESLDNWHSLVERPDIDLLINAGPNQLHAQPSIAAAKNGKHVFCEKPLARTAEEAFSVLKAVESTGVKHMCAFMYRFVPALRLAKKMIAAGEIGEVRHYRSTFLLNMLKPGSGLSWRFDRELAGAGALGDLGSHYIDQARYLVGEVSEVTALSKTWTTDPAGKIKDINDDWFAATAFLDTGATAVFEACRVDAPHALSGRIEIDGTKGSLRFELERLNELEHRIPGHGPRTLMALRPDHPFSDFFLPVGLQGSHPVGWRDCFAFQIYEIVSAIAQQRDLSPDVATFQDGYRVAEIVDTISRSAQTRKAESVRFKL
ncbi:MAG TPA: Gfo/Idh/MocA family oxidoreductase [Chthoniobacterales bacterium]|nr:Gfo/Idh/MocA family oxidoreductase [Chthoniobacterales bacterium]